MLSKARPPAAIEDEGLPGLTQHRDLTLFPDRRRPHSANGSDRHVERPRQFGQFIDGFCPLPTRLHVLFACLGLSFLLIFSWVMYREESAEWRSTQARFRQLERARKNRHQLAQSASIGGLRQIWLPELGRVYRCGTCHLGIDDPSFAGAPAPFAAHPGTWLSTHPTDRFGCTICHDGQGQTTDFADAAHEPQPFVSRPMRPLETIEANCGTCHRGIDPPGAPRLAEGRRLILQSGCFSCHEIPGFEGMTFRGPALDSIGNRVRAEWLTSWLKDPKSYLAQLKMGNFRLSDDEVTAFEAFCCRSRLSVLSRVRASTGRRPTARTGARCLANSVA